MEIQNQMNCRLCDKDITGKSSLLLYDYNENVETQLGRKINIILNSADNNTNLSNYCCDFCSSKIETCFSLLVEIQASDEVIRQTYDNLANDKRIDTATQLFICGECKATISGIKLFIKHYENHILKKTTVGSKKDIVVSNIVHVNNTVDMCNSKSKNISKIINSEHETMPKEKCTKNKYSSHSDPVYDSNVLFTDDCEYTDANSDSLIHLNDDFHENEHHLNSNKDNSDVITEDIDDSDTFSENSDASDSSYKNLVEEIHKELEKSDPEDNMIDIVPNKDGYYDCDTCNLCFEYKFLLKLHLEKNHEAFHDLDVAHTKSQNENSDEGTESDSFMKCCYCERKFFTSELINHILDCKEQYAENKNTLCQICGKMCTFRNLDKHMEVHKKSDGWACDLCGKVFKTKRFLKSHLGEHDESKKKMCEFCGEKFLPLSFFSHIMKHREKKHICQYCGKAFTYNYGLRIHLRIHDNKGVDAKPEKKKDRVFCWLCKKDFDCSVTFNKHLKNDHCAEGLEQDSRFACSQCDKRFADMFSLKAHLKLIHEMKDEDISRLKSLPVYRYIECNVCNKVFNSENKIRIHMKQDHGLKPFEMEILKKECEKCGKKFASKQNLIHHINGAHLHIKPMTCDICQEKFAKHSSLIYHKLRHSGEKPFQCEFCQKSYRQRNDVIRHLARHVRDKELTLEEASAVNNSPSRLVIKRRIFLKDSSINYQAIVRKNRRKSEAVEMEPLLETDMNEVQEEQMEFNENGISESMVYVEEVPADENTPENSSDLQYMNVKPIYNEERNTIILSSPDVMRNSSKNVTYRYIPSQLKHMPAVIVKKQEQI